MDIRKLKADETFQAWVEEFDFQPGDRIWPKFPSLDTLRWEKIESAIYLEALPEEIGAFEYARDTEEIHLGTAAFFFDCRIMVMLPDGKKRMFFAESRLFRPVVDREGALN